MIQKETHKPRKNSEKNPKMKDNSNKLKNCSACCKPELRRKRKDAMKTYIDSTLKNIKFTSNIIYTI